MDLEKMNWRQLVEDHQEALLDDLYRILRVPSVREDDQATEQAPLGPGPKAALEAFLALAEEDGFQTQQFGPWVGRVEIGEGDETFGIVGHVDVVPVGSGWDTDPFEPELIDGKIYARGALDDKGPTMAAYFALKLLRDLDVDFHKQVQIIVGTDEESGWSCMDHYLAENKAPDFGFSPDSRFPIVNGEKGKVSARLTQAPTERLDSGNHLIRLEAGQRTNMVPEEAVMIVESENPDELVDQFKDKISLQDKVQGEASAEGNQVTFKVRGKAAHGAKPADGINAGTHLANLVQDIALDQRSAQNIINLLANELYEGFDGSNLNVDYVHNVMGEVSMNVGIIRYDQEQGTDIDVNFRFPEGTDADTIERLMHESLADYHFDITMVGARDPHYVPGDDPLVRTLLDIYERQTGEPGYEKVIGGGTFAQIMPRGVAYGALFPDSVDTMHQANEYMTLEDLLRCTALYAEAIYRLTRQD